MLKPPLPKGLLVFGFGGHARSVADVALAMGINRLLFIEPMAREGETFMGQPVVSEWDGQVPEGWAIFSAAGQNGQRQARLKQAQAYGWEIATLIAPTASLGVQCEIGAGSFIGHQAHIGPMATIGPGCIINSGAVVEHECKVEGYSHVAVNATVAGRSTVGTRNFIGAGAVVIDGVVLGENIQLGAGAVAVNDLDSPGLYLGLPARIYLKTDC